MATLTTLPTELLQEIFSQLSWQDLISCFYQNSRLFCIVASFVWKDLGDGHWGYRKTTPWRWKIIKRTLLPNSNDDEFSDENELNLKNTSSSSNSSLASDAPPTTTTTPKNRPTLNYAQYIQRIDVSSAFDADFRIDKSLMGYLFANCKNLVEVSLEYHKESLLDDPFLTLKDLHLYVDDFEDHNTNDVTHHHHQSNKVLAPIRRLTMKLYNVSPEPLISLLSSHFTTLQEISLHIVFELTPIPMENLRKLVKNNAEFKKLMLYTIQGRRTFVGDMLEKFRNGGELPDVECWWIPDLV